MKILVGISGSIGVLNIHTYLISLKAQPEVEEVRAIMTPTAARFVNPLALEAILKRQVYVDLWSDSRPMVSPPEVVQGIDLFLVAPASATTISKCATGCADTLVANCYLCHTGPTAFAPAMAPEMWEHPAVKRNFAQLEEYGSVILPAGPGYEVAVGGFRKSVMCSFPKMWPLLQSIVREAKERSAASPPA